MEVEVEMRRDSGGEVIYYRWAKCGLSLPCESWRPTCGPHDLFLWLWGVMFVIIFHLTVKEKFRSSFPSLRFPFLLVLPAGRNKALWYVLQGLGSVPFCATPIPASDLFWIGWLLDVLDNFSTAYICLSVSGYVFCSSFSFFISLFQKASFVGYHAVLSRPYCVHLFSPLWFCLWRQRFWFHHGWGERTRVWRL